MSHCPSLSGHDFVTTATSHAKKIDFSYPSSKSTSFNERKLLARGIFIILQIERVILFGVVQIGTVRSNDLCTIKITLLGCYRVVDCMLRMRLSMKYAEFRLSER
jgi:hypothetical protein